MVKRNIDLIRGDTLAFDVSISEIENVTVESMYFSIKKRKTDDEYIVQKSIGDGITQIDDLKYRVRVAPVDTYALPAGKYEYDLQIGLGLDIYTPLMGTINIMQDITEETVL